MDRTWSFYLQNVGSIPAGRAKTLLQGEQPWGNDSDSGCDWVVVLARQKVQIRRVHNGQ